jgi:hypothetical protein
MVDQGILRGEQAYVRIGLSVRTSGSECLDKPFSVGIVSGTLSIGVWRWSTSRNYDYRVGTTLTLYLVPSLFKMEKRGMTGIRGSQVLGPLVLPARVLSQSSSFGLSTWCTGDRQRNGRPPLSSGTSCCPVQEGPWLLVETSAFSPGAPVTTSTA